MTFDESDGKITQYMTGRTIDYVTREGKELHFFTTDGHEIALQADVNGDIHFKSMGVKVFLPGAIPSAC